MTQLSENFTLEEFEYSDTALEAGIDNSADGDAISCMIYLCTKTLQPFRNYLGLPLGISSGFRCLELNLAIGSDANSQHINGMAADVYCNDIDTFTLAQCLIESGIPFDQLIYEERWLHISSKASHQRMEVLTAVFKKGEKTKYINGLHRS